MHCILNLPFIIIIKISTSPWFGRSDFDQLPISKKKSRWNIFIFNLVMDKTVFVRYKLIKANLICNSVKSIKEIISYMVGGYNDATSKKQSVSQIY